jgi:hypothetical protein
MSYVPYYQGVLCDGKEDKVAIGERGSHSDFGYIGLYCGVWKLSDAVYACEYGNRNAERCTRIVLGNVSEDIFEFREGSRSVSNSPHARLKS